MFSMEMTRLIERCRQGDADALSELYKAYAQKIRGVCRRYVSDEQTVDDVLHDAFVVIFTSFDRLRDARKAESWMMAITRNVALKYKDHLNAASAVPLENAAKLPASEEETTVRGIPLDEVMRMVDHLPEGYANVFRLSVFEGLSHKEIAALLNIAPHSSSSQLARAKKLLKKALTRYWMLWLLPWLLPVALYFYTRSKPTKEELPTATKHDEPSLPVAPNPQTAADSEQHYTADSTIPADTLRHTTEQRESADTVEVPQKQPAPNIHHNNDVDIAETEQHPIMPIQKGRSTTRWGFGFTCSGHFTRSIDTAIPVSMWGQGSDQAGFGSEVPVWEIKTWTDYKEYLPDAKMPEDERKIRIKIAEANIAQGEDEIRRTTHHDLPFTISLALRRQVAHRWSVETGLSYTRLSTQFITGIPQAGFVDVQNIHYLGIPLSVSCQWFGTKSWSLYTSAGAALEIPIRATLTTEYRLDGTSFNSRHQSLNAPLQWSVGTGLGLQYDITPSVGLFAEPRLQYYIPTGSPVETYRTEHPFNFTIPFGIRFTW